MIKATTNVKVTNEKVNSSTDNPGSLYQKLDEHNIYKVLHECNKDMGKYRQYVYYIGTSCDNRKLRLKIQKLQDKIFKNIRSQRDSILVFTRSSPNTAKEKTKLENIICFTLTTLSYLEDLIEKLNYLLTQFPLRNASDLVINLGFEDSTINATEEGNSENQEPNIPNLNNDEISRPRNNNSELYDFGDLIQRIKYIQNLKDEIEQSDVYQVRFNVNSDSHEFFKTINAYNEELKQMSIEEDDSCVKALIRIKNCSRRKCLCVMMLTIIIIVIVVAIIIGIIYAFNK